MTCESWSTEWQPSYFLTDFNKGSKGAQPPPVSLLAHIWAQETPKNHFSPEMRFCNYRKVALH